MLRNIKEMKMLPEEIISAGLSFGIVPELNVVPPKRPSDVFLLDLLSDYDVRYAGPIHIFKCR